MSYDHSGTKDFLFFGSDFSRNVAERRKEKGYFGYFVVDQLPLFGFFLYFLLDHAFIDFFLYFPCSIDPFRLLHEYSRLYLNLYISFYPFIYIYPLYILYILYIYISFILISLYPFISFYILYISFLLICYFGMPLNCNAPFC